MNKHERRTIVSTVIADASEFGEITKDQLLREFEEYDPDKYDPLATLADKIVIRPYKEGGTITVHLTQEEDGLLTDMANRRKISRSALVKALITQGLRCQT